MSESTVVGLRLGRGPNDSLDTPDVLSLGTCLLVVLLDDMLLRKSGMWEGLAEGVASSVIALDEVVDPTVRLRLRTVTVDGMLTEDRGDARGGVLTGAGSLERAE